MEETREPSPLEIRQACLLIQDSWTEKERLRRAPWWAAEQAVDLREWGREDRLAAVETSRA